MPAERKVTHFERAEEPLLTPADIRALPDVPAQLSERIASSLLAVGTPRLLASKLHGGAVALPALSRGCAWTGVVSAARTPRERGGA